MDKKDTCDKCGKLCITKDDHLRGPLEGRYEYLCSRCARSEEAVNFLQISSTL